MEMRMDRIEAPLVRIDHQSGDTSVITFSVPGTDRKPRPGQFYMIKVLAGGFPLFGRALAVLDLTDDGELSFLVKEVGSGTAMMRAMKPGDKALLVGPAGNWFPPVQGKPVLFVAGGTGVAAFHYLLKEEVPENDPVLLFGAQTRESLYLKSALEQLPATVKVSTDDGSEGFKGFVSELMRTHLEETKPASDTVVYCCGPDPMMKAVAGVCRQAELTAYLSLETRMACGIGVCNGCAVEVVRNGKKGFERVCHEGPVFPAHLLPAFN
jgi:dihydroorotate dehydrogenase electron transfer subunit